MTVSLALHPLTRADGSATYKHTATNTTILCGVNFPVEAPARSLLPEECYIEVNVRPHTGVGQVKERHLECLVADMLRSVVLLEMYPRMMLQITLQVMSQGRDEEVTGSGGQGESYLPILAALVNAAVAGCLDAGVGMRGSVVATTVAVMKVTGELRIDPSVKDIKRARSLHVLGFSSVGELELMESEGIFSFEEWENVESLARAACLGGVAEIGDINMQDGEVEAAGKNVMDVLRGAVEVRVMADERWRNG
jgi:exosome complex component RRP46